MGWAWVRKTQWWYGDEVEVCGCVELSCLCLVLGSGLPGWVLGLQSISEFSLPQTGIEFHSQVLTLS